MSWNNGGGPNPWGTPGGNQPKGPEKGPDRGPWGSGKGPGPGGLPDLDELIARMQDKARRFVPGGPGGGLGGMRGNGRLLSILGLVALAIWLASGFYRVQPDEQGVVLRFGAFQRTTLPGLNYHMPWPVEQALTPAVTRINRVEVGFRGGTTDRNPAVRNAGRDLSGGGQVPEEAMMLTGDENIIDINFSVFWRIRDAANTCSTPAMPRTRSNTPPKA